MTCCLPEGQKQTEAARRSLLMWLRKKCFIPLRWEPYVTFSSNSFVSNGLLMLNVSEVHVDPVITHCLAAMISILICLTFRETQLNFHCF